MVRPVVIRAGVGILNVDALYVHGERRLREVCVATGPENGATGLIWIASIPEPKMQFCRRLWVLVSVLVAIRGQQCPQNRSIHAPYQLCRGPLKRICMEGCGRIRNGWCSPTVVSKNNTLAEVVRLDLSMAGCKVVSGEFPVDLV